MPNGSETLEGLPRSDLELIIGAGPRVPESVKQAARAIIIGNLATDTAALLAALERRSQALRQCIADLQTLKAFLDSGPFDDLAGKVSRILDAATASLGGSPAAGMGRAPVGVGGVPRGSGAPSRGAAPSPRDGTDIATAGSGPAATPTPERPAVPPPAPRGTPARVVTITSALITAADSSNPPDYVDSLASVMSDLAEAYAIDTPLRVAHFLSQIGHESSFRVKAESGSYSAKRMREVFGCKGGMKNYDAARDDCKLGRLRDKLWTEEARYAGNAPNLLSYAYALRMGNGDEASGDGFKYRGRGMMQLTGKTNYSDFTRSHNQKLPADRQDFVANPDLLSTELKYGVESAFFFWDANNINAQADRDDIEAVTTRVNGGLNGLPDRRMRLARVRQVLGI